MDLLTRPFDPLPEDAMPLDLSVLLGPAAWSRLPPATRRRFAAIHHDRTYPGTLDLACSRIGQCFARLAALLGGPLTGERGAAVPARVRVYGDGRGGVVWERRLAIPGRAAPRVVRSTKQLGPDGWLVERTDGGLSMELDVFEQDGVLVFRSRRYFLALAGRRLSIPPLLTPGTCRVEHHDLGGGRFRFTLSMVHPLWGRTFEQTGVFADVNEDPA
ncbi:MAG TPA: DUF4166 domain-containing protein [Ramlibacter sp.]|nr:DUF4166 domain-containing protein [Ramlibacter sp.]